MDLHGLFVNEAVGLVDLILKKFKKLRFEKDHKFRIITVS